MLLYRIGFIIEQALGHVTHGQNLHQNVQQDQEIDAYWGLPAWQTSGFAAKIPLYKSNWTVQASLQTRRMIAAMQREVPLDGLFFHTQVTAVLSQKWLRRIPSIVSLDATPIQYDSLGTAYDHASGPGWLERRKWQLNRDCFKTAVHLVTWSEWAKQGLVDAYEVPAEKVTVIPPGVNVAQWQNGKESGKSTNQLVKILFVGGNFERKGGQLLLEAFRALRLQQSESAESTTALELHLVTRDLITSEPGVHVHNDLQPNSERLKKLFHEADIFCLPTYGDCLPMALSEAGAVGLPAVSTNVAAIPEIVRDGETGFVVPVGNGRSLIQALHHLINNPDVRRQQGTQATALVRQSFDAQRNAQKLFDLIKQTIDEYKRLQKK
ncbi:MAG: glycosyltransferase family 4 protein [Chloroflexi bacterium]|nr:glycosyltransferase family 4 protein [Chloroflexota bacterium]